MRYISIYIIPTFCSSLILIKYNLPQYLFHAIRYSSDVILHFHYLKWFDAVFFTLKCTEKTSYFSGLQERKYTKVSRQRNMILSSILTLLKINLSYWELFGPFLLNNSLRLLKDLDWITLTFYLNSNIHTFLISHGGYLLNSTLYTKFLVSDFR